MSTRYVWDKYSTLYTLYYSDEVLTYIPGSITTDDSYCLYVKIYNEGDFTFDETEGRMKFSHYDINQNIKITNSTTKGSNLITVKAGQYVWTTHSEKTSFNTYMYVYYAKTDVVIDGYCEDYSDYYESGTLSYKYSFNTKIKSGTLVEVFSNEKRKKGTTSYGYVTNTSSSKYPNANYSGSYWYDFVGSDSVDPSSVTIPTNAKVKDGTLTATVTPVSNTYGGTISYLYQYSVDDGSTWVSSNTTSSTTSSISIPTDALTMQVRVRASDDKGFTSSDYVYSNTVLFNAPPVISGTDSSIGTFSDDVPSYSYTVTDDDGDMVTVTEKFDNKVLRTYSPTLGSTNTITYTNNEWLEILNGNHTITITADDGNGGVSTRTVTFTKNVTSLSAMFAVPLTADAQIEKAVETVIGNFPEGCSITVEACNNGFDASPIWESFTERVLSGEKFLFTNTIKTADEWGYNVRITVSRGTATGDVYLTGMSGFFE